MKVGNDAVLFLKKELESHPSIAFLDGAGMSTASGIPDFRGQKGIAHVAARYGKNYESLLSVDELYGDPVTFYDFFWHFMIHEGARPNAGHKAVASYPGSIRVITQNIDGLHQAAGSKGVVELHGSLSRLTCTGCHKVYSLEEIKHDGIPKCPACGAMLRPDIVLYGESLNIDAIATAEEVLETSDILIVAGTSLRVYPAAGLIYSSRSRAKFLINAEPTPLNFFFDAYIEGNLNEILPEVLK